MKVYVLLRGIDYEGEELLGVYSSRELAEKARDVYDDNRGRADYYDIEEAIIDAPASSI
jgi:hypothetical protein